MSLPDPRVYELLKSDFILGWHNIIKEDYVGDSHGYSRTCKAVGTTNGAGAHNVQIFVISPDEVVLHALPGFWHPEDLARELRFAKTLWRLWKDKNRTLDEKRALYAKMQLAELRNHPKVTYARSDWQGFDARKERQRGQIVERDTLLAKPNPNWGVSSGMKPINVLVHERMARRAFIPFESFHVGAYVDYGRKFYDNNTRVEKRGVKFRKPRG